MTSPFDFCPQPSRSAAGLVPSHRTVLDPLPYRVGPGLAHRAALGMLVLATDQTIEHEVRDLTRADGIGVFVARLESSLHVCPENLRAMESRVQAAAALLVPGVPLDAVAFGCTSGAVFIGEDRVRARINAAHPGVPVTTPMAAARAALAALDARRIALVTPYTAIINDHLADAFEAHGVTVSVLASFLEDDDARACRIDGSSLHDAMIAAGRAAPVDAVFVSCTSLRAVALVSAAEAALVAR